MTLWSLVNKSISYIKYPKLTHMQDGLDFTGDGKYMALAERRDCRDFVSIFDCSQWQLVKNFPVETKDLAGLSWSPDGKVLCVWDSCLDYKVLLYSMDGRSVASYSAYEHALGVKCVRWSPSSQFLAIGSYDQKIRVLNHVTWKTVAAHSHPATVDFSSVVVYTEVERKPQNLKGGEPSFLVTKNTFPHQSKYETSEIPVTVPTLKPDPENPIRSWALGQSSSAPTASTWLPRTTTCQMPFGYGTLRSSVWQCYYCSQAPSERFSGIPSSPGWLSAPGTANSTCGPPLGV